MPNEIRTQLLNQLVAAIKSDNEYKIKDIRLAIIKEMILKELDKLPKSNPDIILQDTLVAELKHRQIPGIKINRTPSNRHSTFSHGDAYTIYENEPNHKIKIKDIVINLSAAWVGSSSSTGMEQRVTLFNDYEHVNIAHANISDVCDFIANIGPMLDEWQTKTFENVMLEAKKDAKKKSITENTIETLLAAKMKGTGIPYATERQKIRVKVYFHLGHKLNMEMVLSHKNFMKQIDMVIDTAKNLKKLVDETKQPLKIKSDNGRIKWQGMEEISE